MSAATKWGFGGVIAAIAAGAVVAYTMNGSREKPAAYVTVAADRGNIIGKVTATGTLSALVTVQVGTQVSGRLKELFVDFNSPVKKGQVLAKIDPELFEAALAQAKANEQAADGSLARARAEFADNERKLTRSKQLAEQKLIAQADLDTAIGAAEMSKASIQAAEGQVAQARAQRHQAEVNRSYTTIYSPIDGTVVSRAIDVGQTVAASLSAPTLFTIAENLSRMQVDTNVAEADVGKLKEGIDTMFTVDAFLNRPFRGRIRQIRFAAQVVSNVVTYDAVIDVDNPELLLRPGMTANVTFIYARADDALKVPNAALRFRLDGLAAGGARGQGGRGQGSAGGEQLHALGDGGMSSGGERAAPPRTVYVLKDSAPVAVPVQIGITDGSSTEITGGLEEGAQVIIERADEGPKSPAPTNPPPAGGMRRMF